MIERSHPLRSYDEVVKWLNLNDAPNYYDHLPGYELGFTFPIILIVVNAHQPNSIVVDVEYCEFQKARYVVEETK